MTEHKTETAAAVTDEAISWLIRLRDPACTRQERKQFEAWLKADSAHAREYQNLLEIWTVSGNLQPSLTVPKPLSAAAPRLRYLRSIVLALILLAAGLWARQSGWLPVSYHRYNTGAQTQQVTLPDGSEVQMGMETSLAFLRFRDRREIRFHHGEALFSARHEPSAALYVHIGDGRITATDTHFNVWFDEDCAVVTAVKGTLELDGKGRRDGTVVLLSVGQQTRFSKAAPLPKVSSANLEHTLAWRQGKLILDDTPLTDALPLINRYLGKPLRLGDEAAARVHIGGIYNTRDMEGLVRVLPRIAPVRIARDSDGNRVIYSAPRRSLQPAA